MSQVWHTTLRAAMRPQAAPKPIRWVTCTCRTRARDNVGTARTAPPECMPISGYACASPAAAPPRTESATSAHHRVAVLDPVRHRMCGRCPDGSRPAATTAGGTQDPTQPLDPAYARRRTLHRCAVRRRTPRSPNAAESTPRRAGLDVPAGGMVSDMPGCTLPRIFRLGPQPLGEVGSQFLAERVGVAAQGYGGQPLVLDDELLRVVAVGAVVDA